MELIPEARIILLVFLNHYVQTESDFMPPLSNFMLHWATAGGIFGCHSGGYSWHLVGRGQDASRHPMVHRTARPQRSPAQDAHSAKAEKPCEGIR